MALPTSDDIVHLGRSVATADLLDRLEGTMLEVTAIVRSATDGRREMEPHQGCDFDTGVPILA